MKPQINLSNTLTVFTVLIFSSLMLVSSGSSHADGSTIPLRFNWPVNMVSDVDYSSSTFTTGTDQNQKTTMVGKYVLTTSEHDRGLQVEISNSEVQLTEDSAQNPPELQGILELFYSINPSYTVSDKGELLEVIKIDEIAQHLKNELEPLFPEFSEESSDGTGSELKAMANQIKSMMDQVVSEESLLALTQQAWKQNVGQWIDAELEIGSVSEVEFSTPNPMLGNVQILTKGTYEVLGYVSCDADAGSETNERVGPDTVQKPGCVELRFTSKPDPESSTKVINEMFKSMNTEVPDNFEMKMDYVFFLITEPDTLVPHSSLETSITTTGSLFDGSEPIIQTSTSRRQFEYPER